MATLSASSAQVRFRQQFKRSLKSCIRRDFSVAECFGTIWQETLEEISIPESEQRALYQELLQWAKRWN